MRKLLKAVLPSAARRGLRLLMKMVRYRWRRGVIAAAVCRGEPMKIIVGAAETWQRGWYSTQEQWLDVTKAADWQKVFGGKKLLTHVVAEHVFEHLTAAECASALANIAAHMMDRGHIRIAVPDGFHPDPDYRRYVGIGGIGDASDDHKQFLTVEALSRLLREVGFVPDLIEGYDRAGKLVAKHWSDEEGYINRSRQNPPDTGAPYVDARTSLIVDGVKV